MKNSTKHMLAQRLIGFVAVLIFLGATKIWPIPGLHLLPDWVGLIGLFVLFGVIISGLGLGPWGKAVNNMLIKENEEYQNGLKPNQPWKESNDA